MSSAERIEKCLSAWEDFYFAIEMANGVFKAQGKPPLCVNEKAVVNWSILRKRILDCNQKEGLDFNCSDFSPPRGINEYDIQNNSLANLIWPIIGWCLNSRRIYQIPKDLQAVLSATSLEGVRWKDVYLPFPSYAVKLESPFIDCDGDKFDFIFVNTYKVSNLQTRAFEIHFLTEGCDFYNPLRETRKQNIRKDLRERKYERVLKWLEKFLPFLDKILFGNIAIFAKDFDEEVLASAERVFGECDQIKKSKMGGRNAIETWNTAIRIVVGMCLYLKTLPPQSPHHSEWRPAVRFGLPDPKAISNEAQICTVTSCYNLSREEKIMLGLEGTPEERATYELCCHFREGHWRRPPGQGSDPNAQKTVHVRPCLVRKDRLREGELPGGTQENM